MCLPLAAIGAIAMAAGAGMQYLGQQKADHALSSTFNREEARQKQFQADQQAAFKDSLNSTSNMADPVAQAKAAANRLTAFQGVTQNANPTTTGYLPTAGSAPAIVATEGERAGAKANAATGQLAKALAAMGGFGDLQQQTNLDIGHNDQKIGQIGSFMRGSLDALQPEMDAARRKGSTLRTLGGLAQSIGSAMLSGGLGGAPINSGAASIGNANLGSALFGGGGLTGTVSLPAMTV